MKPHFFLDQSGSFLETKYITRSTMSKEQYYYRGKQSRQPDVGGLLASLAMPPRPLFGRAEPVSHLSDFGKKSGA